MNSFNEPSSLPFTFYLLLVSFTITIAIAIAIAITILSRIAKYIPR